MNVSDGREGFRDRRRSQSDELTCLEGSRHSLDTSASLRIHCIGGMRSLGLILSRIVSWSIYEREKTSRISCNVIRYGTARFPNMQ
ncbi:hypothetical protein RB195_025797 [Necator americanus]|uniref:Uncharacterized protein n=1 Tax=Necator americanus TaxID=51031 RepID=A0ABR1ETY2_NECAM